MPSTSLRDGSSLSQLTISDLLRPSKSHQVYDEVTSHHLMSTLTDNTHTHRTLKFSAYFGTLKRTSQMRLVYM